MSRMTHRATGCVSAIAAISLSGCGASVSVGEQLENPDKVLAGLLVPAPASVTCPSTISARAGTTFTCRVVASNGKHATLGVLEDRRGHIEITAINGRAPRAGTSTNTHTATATGTSG